MYPSLILACSVILSLVAGQPKPPVCNLRRAVQCSDVLANRLGFPPVPNDSDLPKDFNQFIAVIRDLITGHRDMGFETLCGLAFEYYECLGTQIAVCTNPTFLVESMGLTGANAISYRAFQTQLSQECSAMLQGSSRFNCRNRRLNSFHLAPESGCGTAFYACGPSGFPFKGICPTGQTLDLESLECRQTTEVARCAEKTTEYAKTEMRKFSCPQAGGRYFNPTMECSMLFYACSKNRPILTMCNSGTYFDPHDLECKQMHRIRSCQDFMPNRIAELAEVNGVKMECDISKPKPQGCLDIVAQAVHLPPIPNNVDLPADSFAFLRQVDSVLVQEGRAGLERICRAVDECLICVTENGLTCFSEENFVNMLGFTEKDARNYKSFFARWSFECQSIIGLADPEPFTCADEDGIKQDGIYLPNSNQCSRRFSVCMEANVLFGRCPEAYTIDPQSLKCRRVEKMDRCLGVTYAPEPEPTMRMPVMECPSGKRAMQNPLTECSMLFIRCSNGKASIGRCQSPYVFDEDTNSCKHPSKVRDCGAVSSSQQTPPKSSSLAHGARDQTCSRQLATQCFDGLAERLGFQSVPNDQDLPRDFSEFMAVIKRMLESRGQHALEELCGFAHEMFECLGTSVVACSDPDYLVSTFGFTKANAITYHAYHSQTSQECAAALQGLPRFNCADRELDAFHLSSNIQCRNTFYICSKNGLPFKGICKPGYTLDTTSGSCRLKNDVTRCRFIPVETPPIRMRPFTCSHKSGLFDNPDMECSMLFYECIDKNPRLHICPGETYFDRRDRLCKPMRQVSTCRKFVTEVPGVPDIEEPAMKTECEVKVGQSNRCIRTFARSIGLEDLPDDSFVFLNTIDNILLSQGRAGLTNICRAVTEFLTCIPQIGLECFTKESLKTVYGTTEADADAYIQFFQRFGFECQAIFGEVQPFTCDDKGDGIYVPKERPCSKQFLICYNEILLFGQCSRGKTIEPKTIRCIRRESVDRCADAVVNVEPTPQVIMPNLACSPAYSSSKNPVMSCSMLFVRCEQGVPSIGRCPDMFVFDEDTNSCKDTAYVRDCGGRTHVTPPMLDCSYEGDGNIENPRKSCSNIYYSCVGGTTFERECIAGTRYDKTEDLCDNPENIPSCGGSRPLPPPPAEPVPKVDFDCEKSGIFLNPRHKCSYVYYSCLGGVASELKCATHNLRYSKKLDLCDEEQYVPECGGRPRQPTREEPQPQPKPVNFDCKARSDGFYPSERGCSTKFYSCTDEVPRELYCSHGHGQGQNELVFDKEQERCNERKYVPQCGGTRPSPIEDPKPVAPKQYFTHAGFACAQAGNVGDPRTACSRSYVACSDNMDAELMPCPANMFYDPSDDQCKAYGEIQVCRLQKVIHGEKDDAKLCRYDGVVPKGKCNQNYAICSRGEYTEAKCPYGHSLSAEHGECKLNSEINC